MRTRFVNAVCCKTLTKVSETPIPGHPNPPQPLRSASSARGLAGLATAHQGKVDAANKSIDFQFVLASCVEQKGGAAVIEKPRTGSLRPLLQPKLLMNWAGSCRRIWLVALRLRGIKGQALLTNVKQMQGIQSKCHHSVPRRDGSRARPGGKWRYPIAEEAEYTAELAFFLAISPSPWALERGKTTFRVPHLPLILQTESRAGPELYPPQSMRSEAMQCVGL